MLPTTRGAFSVFIHPITGPFFCLEERLQGSPGEALTQGRPRRQYAEELRNGSLVVKSGYTPRMLNCTSPAITLPGCVDTVKQDSILSDSEAPPATCKVINTHHLIVEGGYHLEQQSQLSCRIDSGKSWL